MGDPAIMADFERRAIKKLLEQAKRLRTSSKNLFVDLTDQFGIDESAEGEEITDHADAVVEMLETVIRCLERVAARPLGIGQRDEGGCRDA